MPVDPAAVKGAMRLMEPVNQRRPGGILFQNEKVEIILGPLNFAPAADEILVRIKLTNGTWARKFRGRCWQFRLLQEALKEMDLIDVES